MTINDIKVGAKYHDQMTGNILLGIGMRKLFTDGPNREYTEKHLAIIESEDPACIGLMIQEGENAMKYTWDFIEEYDPENMSRIYIMGRD